MAPANNSDNNKIKLLRQAWLWFAITCIVVTIVTAIAFVFLHKTNSNRQDRIFSIFENNINYADSLLAISKAELLDSLRANPKILLDDYNTLDRITRIAEELESNHVASSVLEVEANKIQNQYEALGIWGAIITIVFLIFSFYNLFKSEEIRKEGQEALVNLRSLTHKAQLSNNEITTFSSKAETKLNEIENNADKTLDKIKNKYSGLDKKIDKLSTDFESQYNSFFKLVEEKKTDYNTQLLAFISTEKNKLQKYLSEELKRQKDMYNPELNVLKRKLDALEHQVEGLSKDNIEDEVILGYGKDDLSSLDETPNIGEDQADNEVFEEKEDKSDISDNKESNGNQSNK